ncbi:hypothetical protein DSECCO2_257690 [anaerobic digester metagenome]
MKTNYFILFLLIVNLFFVSSCGNQQKSPEQLRMELAIQEKSQPLFYLSTDELTMKQNLVKESSFFSDAEYDGWIVEGVIKSTATIAKFKDIVITVQLYSQTETLLEEKEFIIYEFFEPNSTKPFKVKLYPTEVCKRFNVFVKSATAVD